MLPELQDEEVDLGELLAREPGKHELADIRRMAIRLEQLQGDLDENNRVKQAVVQAYVDRATALQAQVDDLREHLQAYIERVRDGERVVFADVGTLYLHTVPGRVAVSNPQAASDDPDVKANEDLWSVVFNVPEYRKLAAERFKAHGELMPGCEHVPPRKTLAVKRA